METKFWRYYTVDFKRAIFPKKKIDKKLSIVEGKTKKT